MNNLITYYRITSIPSTNPSPIYQEDKDKLNELCLKSFVSAFKEVKPKTIFICDHCSEDTLEMIYNVCPFEKEVMVTHLGINETCLLQYKLASKQDEEIILFLECDYWWNTALDVNKYISGIKELGLVSPYNHLNYYKDKEAHSNICQIELVDDHIFRSVETCTMTFGLRKDILIKYLDIFNKYGYLDHFVWLDIAKEGQKLFCPIPTFATHSVIDYLAPQVKWENIFKNLNL